MSGKIRLQGEAPGAFLALELPRLLGVALLNRGSNSIPTPEVRNNYVKFYIDDRLYSVDEEENKCRLSRDNQCNGVQQTRIILMYI